MHRHFSLFNFSLLKLDGNGDIPGCSIEVTSYGVVKDTDANEKETNVTVEDTNATLPKSSVTAMDGTVTENTICSSLSNPAITVSPTRIDFANVPVGESADREVTISNGGTKEVMTAEITFPLSPFSIVSDSCSGHTIAPGGSCSLTVRFGPTTAGTHYGYLDIYLNDSYGSVLVVSLSGGTSVALLTPNTPRGPASGLVGTSYSYRTGGSKCNSNKAVEYQFDWKGDGSDLSGWGSATQSKIWSLAGIYNIVARGRCSHYDMSSWSSPLAVSINLPNIFVTPLSFDFGKVKVNRSKTASFKVKNNGTVDLSISTSITGTDASMFKITIGDGSNTIKAGKSLTVRVAFGPTSFASESSILRIASNDPDTPTFDIPLVGMGQ